MVITVVLFSCKSSKFSKDERKEIVSGSILFEVYNDLSNYDVDKDLADFLNFQHIFMDSILDFPMPNIELKTKEDSIYFKKYFDKGGNPNTELWMKLNRDTTLVKLDIYPEFYFKPEFISHGRRKEFVKFGDKISKDGLNRCFGVPSKPCNYKKILFKIEENYDVRILKSNRKQILGYDCFLIKIVNRRVKTLYYHLYVTEQIKMNYNPLFNHKSLNDMGYFILEKTRYAPNQKKITKVKAIDLNY